MTDASTVALLTEAAELAEKAAGACDMGGPWSVDVRDCDAHVDSPDGHVALIGRETWPSVSGVARLIAASGPDHWRAVAATLRRTADRHQVSDLGNAFGGYDCQCGQTWLDTLGGCPSLTDVLDLARQVITDLGAPQ